MTREELIAAGEFAFPSGDGEYGGGPNHYFGMTLRDWFAGKALATIISLTQSRDGGWDEVAVAAGAYAVADAMLQARTALSSTDNCR
jgi:hypothetical protein